MPHRRMPLLYDFPSIITQMDETSTEYLLDLYLMSLNGCRDLRSLRRLM